MSFLVDRPNHYWTSLASICGIGSFVFPLSVPWHLIFLFAAAACHIAVRRWAAISVAVTCLFIGSVLAGLLPSPIATALLAALTLLGSPFKFFAVAILLLNTSIMSTLVQLSSQKLHLLGLEATAPALVAIACVWLFGWQYWLRALIAAACTLALALAARQLQISPFLQMAAVALPVFFLVFSLHARPFDKVAAIPVIAVATALIVSWIVTPPRNFGQTYLLIPSSESAAEFKYFKNYQGALAFAGIPAKKTMDANEIPTDALVIMPWLTASFNDDNDDGLMQSIGNLARERRWTVVLAGEHNDLGGSAKRMLALTDKFQTRNDLTVPPGNTDDSGPLHVSGLGNWPHEAAFNRGASVPVSSLLNKILLAGDGWWAERDIGEWLWVGDYIWQPGDRAGRLSLSVAFDDRGARWVIVGDNTPFLNLQLFADPRPALQLIQNATLWPALQRDALLCICIVLLLLPSTAVSEKKRLGAVLVITVLFPAFSFASSEGIKTRSWQDTYVRQSGFDQRNFNEVFADTPALFEGRRVIRKAAAIKGALALPSGPLVVFMAVDETAEIAGVKLRNCRRLGSLRTTEGPLLMDAQACQVDGAAEILLGTKQGAAAISVGNASDQAIIVLDTAFLAQNSPEANVKWLMNQLSSNAHRK